MLLPVFFSLTIPGYLTKLKSRFRRIDDVSWQRVIYMRYIATIQATFADKKLHMIMLGIISTLVLALIVPWGIGSHYYFYQALTIVICAGSGVSDTWQSSRSRILATCFGLGTGSVAAYILPMNPWVAIIGYLLIFFIAERFEWQEYINAGGSMFLVVYLYHNATNNENVFVYSGWRLLHTLVGVMIILLISRYYLKSDVNGYKKLVMQITDVSDHVLTLVKKTLADNRQLQEADLERLKRDLLDVEKLYEFVHDEHKLLKKQAAGLIRLAETIALMDDMRVWLYYLWAYAYKPEQLDDNSRALVAEVFGCKRGWPEAQQPVYTNNLAVRKLSSGWQTLQGQLRALKDSGDML